MAQLCMHERDERGVCVNCKRYNGTITKVIIVPRKPSQKDRAEQIASRDRYRGNDFKKSNCAARIKTSWSTQQCGNGGEIEEHGHKWCVVHAPSKVAFVERMSEEQNAR